MQVQLRALAVLVAAAVTCGTSAQGDVLALVQTTAKIGDVRSVDMENNIFSVLSGIHTMMTFDTTIKQLLDEALESPVDPANSATNFALQDSELAALTTAPALGTNTCTDDDQVHMNGTLKALLEVAMTKGPAMVLHTLPTTCGLIATRGLNISAYKLCLQEFFEITPGCSACHVGFLQSILGSDIFHLGCIPKCLPMATSCKKPMNDGPTKDCLGATTKCMQCTFPAYKDILGCVRVPAREQGIQLMDNFLAFMKSGNVTNPGGFQDFMRRTGSAIAH